MSAVVMCDECGSVLLRSLCIHCVDAVLRNGKRVYGADICSSCLDKYDFPYDIYGVHAKPKESESSS